LICSSFVVVTFPASSSKVTFKSNGARPGHVTFKHAPSPPPVTPPLTADTHCGLAVPTATQKFF
jgi:hypothetical protein